jgi:hypothetical protein
MTCSGNTDTCRQEDCRDCALRDCPLDDVSHYNDEGCDSCDGLLEGLRQLGVGKHRRRKAKRLLRLAAYSKMRLAQHELNDTQRLQVRADLAALRWTLKLVSGLLACSGPTRDWVRELLDPPMVDEEPKEAA